MFKEPETKRALLVTAFGVCLFAALMNLPAVLDFAGKLIDLILPLIVGGILALFIHVPMSGIEKRLKWLCRKRKKQPSDGLLHILSFILTLLCLLLVLVLVLTLLVPEIVRSSGNLYEQIRDSIPRWSAALSGVSADLGWLEGWFSSIDWEQTARSLSDGLDVLVGTVAKAFSSTVSVVVTAAFAVVTSIYISLSEASLGRQAQKLIRAYLKPSWAEKVLRFCQMFSRSFANFLTGQCSEAVILGVLMFVAFSLFHLPYGSLVGVLTAFCAIIPYVGAFISASISVLLVLLIDPALALRSLLVYLAVQSVENHFIYPRVVGSSVGLSPFYTLIAAMVGGKLFGILGILFFIPLTAVIIELIKEDASRRLEKRAGRIENAYDVSSTEQRFHARKMPRD